MCVWRDLEDHLARMQEVVRQGREGVRRSDCWRSPPRPPSSTPALAAGAGQRSSDHFDSAGKQAASDGGYLSSDFHEHAVPTSQTELYEQHDRERFQVFAYSIAVRRQSRRQRLRNAVDRFIDCGPCPTREQPGRSMRMESTYCRSDGYTGKARTEIVLRARRRSR